MFKNFKKIIIFTLLLLIIPLLGNVFVDGWVWTIFDFMWAFIMLFTAMTLVDISYRRYAETPQKFLVIGFIILIFLIVWVEAATGGLSDRLENYLSTQF